MPGFLPYPSGEGLHVGHCRNYVPTDVLSRYKRMNGYNVLHPMGWDAFGEPAEQYAVAHGVHPRVTTDRNAANYRRQLSMIGASYDWSREIDFSQNRISIAGHSISSCCCSIAAWRTAIRIGSGGARPARRPFPAMKFRMAYAGAAIAV